MSKWWILALALSLSPLAAAQGHGGTPGRPGFGGLGNGAFRGGWGWGRGNGYGSSFWDTPFLYSDYPAGSMANATPPQPHVNVPLAPPPPTAEPLLIEYRDGRYVRVTGNDTTPRPAAYTPDYAEPAGHSAPNAAPSVPVASAALPPAVLIFRDGHQEQVSDYVIANRILYAKSDYALSGAATRNIPLSSLDLTATVSANRDRGVKFVLPSGPYEVVTRP